MIFACVSSRCVSPNVHETQGDSATSRATRGVTDNVTMECDDLGPPSCVSSINASVKRKQRSSHSLDSQLHVSFDSFLLIGNLSRKTSPRSPGLDEHRPRPSRCIEHFSAQDSASCKSYQNSVHCGMIEHELTTTQSTLLVHLDLREQCTCSMHRDCRERMFGPPRWLTN